MTSKQFYDLFIILVSFSIITETVADTKTKINPKVTFSADKRQATLTFELNQPTHVYELERNDNLLLGPTNKQANCYYDDALKGPWAAISTCNSHINGAIDVGGKLMEIIFDSKANAHFLKEFSELVFESRGGDDGAKIESESDEADTKDKSRTNDVLIPNNGPKDVSIRIHGDIEFMRTKLGDPMADANETIHLVMLHVARFYKPVNIRISYSNEFFQRDEIPIHRHLFHQLKAFKNLTKVNPSGYEGVDLNCLLTGHHYPAEFSLGIAFVGGFCSPDYNMFIVTSKPSRNTFATPMQLALTLAHEVGHTFGLKHDTKNDPDCLCFTTSKSKKCIMAKKIFYPPYEWSDCTFNHLLEFSKKQSGCIRDTRDENREPFPEKLYNVTSLRLNALLAGLALGIILIIVAIGVHKFTLTFTDEQ